MASTAVRLSERVPHAFLQGLKPRDRRADVGPKGPTPKEFTPLADSRGLPETRRKRMPSSPACTTTSSPRSKRTRERLSAADGGVVSSQPTDSVGTERGSLALQNLPEPAKTYAKAWRVVSTGSVFLRPGATDTST